MGTIDKKSPDTLDNFIPFSDTFFKKKTSLLIIIHDNPDPDSIASAWILQYLISQRYCISVSIAYGGVIRRAENKTMIQKLKIIMKQIRRIKFPKYDCIALVDTQPGAGNNSLPENIKCDIVIDHHPIRSNIQAGYLLIQPDIGATATLLVDIMKSSHTEIKTDHATALSYAISSETQNLKRETNKRDIEAFLYVYNKCNVRTLGEIMHPKLPRTYFITLSKALKSALYFKNLICVHLGDIPNPEIVAEMADFFHRHERITRVFCTGKFRNFLILSLRNSIENFHAGKMIQKIVKDKDTAGGHESTAGGYILLQKTGQKEITLIESSLRDRFAQTMGFKKSKWSKLI